MQDSTIKSLGVLQEAMKTKQFTRLNIKTYSLQAN